MLESPRIIATGIRLPRPLHEALKAEAAANHRSLSSVITERLERSVAKQDQVDRRLADLERDVAALREGEAR